MAEPLNILAFRMSRRRVDDLTEVLYPEEADGVKQPAYLYAGDSCYILINDEGEPYLTIYNQEWAGRTIEELEFILYEEFYLPEICGISAEDYHDRCRDAALYEKEKQS